LAYSLNLNNEATCPPNHRLTFSRLHGVTSQKIELFIKTAVRTLNPSIDTAYRAMLEVASSGLP
jgi:hypothetical protein